MKLEIEVKRRRFSVTQGQADVYVNGEMVISFGDTIEIINDGQPYYSEKIGNWASTVPDSMFIRGLLFHPYDDVYHYSEKVKRILDAESERLETMNWHIETSDGIKQEMPFLIRLPRLPCNSFPLIISDGRIVTISQEG